MSQANKPPGDRTRAVHGPEGRHHRSIGTPIERSVAFSFESLEALKQERDRGAAGGFYQRLGHPTVRGCEERLALLERAEEALLFASGSAAIMAVFMAHLTPGDHIVTLAQGYGGTLHNLQWAEAHLGWSFDLVDARDPGSWANAFRDETRILHIESPTNPTLDVVDLSEAAALAHAHGAILSVDNTVASPIGQRPLEAGADLVTYSATKSIGGHTDLLAGAALGRAAALEPLSHVRVVMGGSIDPEVAWLIERSLKTLPLRVEAGNANALAIAKRLAQAPGVKAVHYPGLDDHPGRAIAARQMRYGFGPLLAFQVEGGDPAAAAVIDGLSLIHHAASLGSIESLACLPSETSHRFMTADELRRIGIPEGMIRLSVGIEDEADLWADLSQALAGAGVASR